MTINGIGTTAYSSTISNNKAKSTQDDEIKFLMQQKETLKKEINETNAGNQSDEIKQQRVKTLEQQMQQIDSEIQQKQLEAAKEKVEDAQSTKNTDNGSANTNQYGKDSVQLSSNAEVSQLKQYETYNKLGKLVSLSESLKSKANETISDAEVLGGIGSGKHTAAAKLYSQGAEMSARADSTLSSAFKKAADVNKTAENDLTASNKTGNQENQTDSDEDKSGINDNE